MELHWIAVYNDHSYLAQYNGLEAEGLYANIDREKLVEFQLQDRESGRLVLSQFLDQGQRLIFRRRIFLHQQSGQRQVFYMVGWQQTIHGENVQAINYVTESGTVLAAGRFREDHPLFYSIMPVPGEG